MAMEYEHSNTTKRTEEDGEMGGRGWVEGGGGGVGGL